MGFIDKLLGREKSLQQNTTTVSTLTVPEVPPTNNTLLNFNARPLIRDSYSNSEIEQYPKFWVKYDELQQWADQSDILGTVFDARKTEIFRKGIAIKPLKGKESTGLDTKTVGKETGEWTKAVDDRIESFINEANANKQDLIEVLQEIELDQCTFDEGYLLAQFEYEFTEDGMIIGKHAKEFLRLDPRFTRIVCDTKNQFGRNANGEKVYFSLHDRSSLITETQAKKTKYKDQYGMELFPAWYVHDPLMSGAQNNGRKTYYAEWEVCHASEFNPSLTYSKLPPIMRVWMKVWTAIKMDEYMMKNYALQRPPKFFLVFNTTNLTSLEKAYNQMIQDAELNPNIPGIMANESKETGGGVQVIDLMRPLDEMRFIETRQELRQQIGAAWGVMPIWQADISTSGGLNNEGMQITVTNRAVEKAQSFYNRKYLRFITKCLGATDRALELNPSEELDEVAKLQQQAMKLQNANTARQLGLTVEFDEETGEFTYTGQVKELPENNGFSGGLFGGGGGFSGDNENIDMGFDSAPDSTFSGTSGDEMMQSDAKGFRSPARSGDTKAAKVMKRLGSEFSDKLLRDLDPLLKEIEKLSLNNPAKARAAINELAKQLQANLVNVSTNELLDAYDLGRTSVKEFKQYANYYDESSVEKLLRNPLYNENLAGVVDAVKQAAGQALVNAVTTKGTYSLKDVREGLRQLGTLAEKEVRTLARTYTNQFFQAGRRTVYLQAEKEAGEEFVYTWSGPTDDRTTQCCKNVKERIAAAGGAVTWNNLATIVDDESKKEFPTFIVDPYAPTAHWNCRHIALRVVK